MDDFGAFGEVASIGDIEGRQGFGLEWLVGTVSLGLHRVLIEVHVYESAIDLGHAILESGGDAEFFGFDGEDEIGEFGVGYGDIVAFHETTQAGGDDGAGACESDLVGDIGGVVQGKVAVVERIAAFGGIVVEFFDGCFEQADAAVVSKAIDVAGEFIDAIEAGVVASIGENFEVGGFVEDDIGAEIHKGEGDGFAEVAIGWISYESAARIGFLSNHHGVDVPVGLCMARL